MLINKNSDFLKSQTDMIILEYSTYIDQFAMVGC